MKKQILIFVFLLAGITSLFAQTNTFTETFKKQFAGTWQKQTRYQTNTIKIKFEKGKDYATVTDIGSGEAPPHILRAYRKGNILIVKPFQEHNDNCELEVKGGKLIFRTQPTIWNEDGTAQPPGNFFGKKVFKKVKK